MIKLIKYSLGIILIIIGAAMLIDSLSLPKVFTGGSTKDSLGIALVNSLKSEFIALSVFIIGIGVLILFSIKYKGRNKK